MKSELKISIWLFGVCLAFMCFMWMMRFVNHFYRSDVLFFGLGGLHLVLIWALVERIRNYRRLDD